MERLTLYYKSRKQYDIIQTCDKHENEQREIMAMNKLAEYENTGLEPSEVENLKKGLRESFTKEFQDLIKEHEELAIYKKALELAVNDYITSEQELISNCIIEGGILSDIGFEEESKYCVKFFLNQARKEVEDERN